MRFFFIPIYILIINFSLIACNKQDTLEHPIQPNGQDNQTVADVEEMVMIPAGEVTIGTNEKTDLTSGNEADLQVVFVEEFYIDKYEVTNAQYAKFLSATGHRKPKFWDNPSFNNPKQPIVGVNWEDAATFAQWMGKRLPTDIEWEKAARSTDERLYPWGNVYEATMGNFDDSGLMNGNMDGFAMQTAPVGSFTNGVSPYGLHDMSGNVWEWVTSELPEIQDRIGRPEQTNGTVYTIRGGSWTNGPGDTRATVFYIYPAQCSDHSSSVGFRCAMTP